jgi:outer membrane lipoprotein-sorting protein
MRSGYRVGISALFLLFFFPAHGEVKSQTKASKEEVSAETRLALRSVSERYRKLRHWTADFSQETFSTGLGRGTFQTGQFRFLEPSHVDFDLSEPDASRFVSNGREAWQLKYSKGKGKAAEGYHFSQVSDLELSRYLIFLRGIDVSSPAKEKELFKDYKVSAKVDASTIALTLVPKQNSEVSSVELYFSQTKVPPEKIVLEDEIGNRTTVTLTKADTEAKLDPATFKPEIPRGSKIVEK